MIKKDSAIRTVEGFIRKLKEDGHSDYASQLRTLMAMSRERKDAVTALSFMAIPLVEHIIKYVILSDALEKNKWAGEIKGLLRRFDIRNKKPKKGVWLQSDYIKDALNDILSSSDFLLHMKEELENPIDKNKVTGMLRSHKTLKSLGIELVFNYNNNLNIVVNKEPL